jgi:hypothetical protein
VKDIYERHSGLTLAELQAVEKGQCRLLAGRAALGIDQGAQSLQNLQAIKRRLREIQEGTAQSALVSNLPERPAEDAV